MSAKLTFVLSARDLPSRVRGSLGLSSIPDPFVKVWHKDSKKPEWTKLAKTNHVVNSNNPDFTEVISFEWKQGTGQVWRMHVLDYDPMNANDLIGGIEVDVDKFVLQQNKDFSGKLPTGGTLNIKGTQPISFHIQLNNLPKLDGSSGSDPYVECFWSYGKHGETHRFHKTTTVDDARNVKWNEAATLVNYVPGTNQYLTFKVFDEDTVSDDVIGQVTFIADLYVNSRKPAVYQLNAPWNHASITITPVLDTLKK